MISTPSTPRTTRRRSLRFAVPVLADVLLIAGIILVVTAPRLQVVGWTAYAPLAQNVDTGISGVTLAPQQIVGVSLAAVALLMLTGWVAYRLGLRGRDRPVAAA